MKIIEKIEESKGNTFVSVEFFPPRSATGVANLEARWERMRDAVDPLFADITWGAGGSTSSLTMELTMKLKKVGMEPNTHLTCTNVKKEEVEEALQSCRDAGVKNIVALRGDPPVGQEKWEATDESFKCALDLVKFIRKVHGDYFNISVAGYPEGHPDAILPTSRSYSELSEAEQSRCRIAPDGTLHVCNDAKYAEELAYLKAKVDAGSDMIITQMFFDCTTFAAFVKAARNVGITVPIIPGIMVLQSAVGFKKMTNFCKTRVPPTLAKQVDACGEDEQQLKQLGIQLGVDMGKQLIAQGVEGLHFYTLNLEKSTLAIIQQLGLSAEQRNRSTKNGKSSSSGGKSQEKPPIGPITWLGVAAVIAFTAFVIIKPNIRR